MAKKKSAAMLMLEQGLAKEKEQATRLVMAGLVFIQMPYGLERIHKAGQLLPGDVTLELQEVSPFVSRGGYKLLTALEHYKLDVTDFVCLDAGASTGGFTDCLLQYGAKRVYAVDVGKNQLHEKLRKDNRVISMEGVNVRLAEKTLLPENIDMVVADVSFISVTQVLSPCLQWLKEAGYVAALIKPQFEVASHETVKGVVRDPVIRQRAVDEVLAFAAQQGLELLGVVPASIKGPKGNQEYMAVWRKLA